MLDPAEGLQLQPSELLHEVFYVIISIGLDFIEHLRRLPIEIEGAYGIGLFPSRTVPPVVQLDVNGRTPRIIAPTLLHILLVGQAE
jgi:hypothetical protein